MCGLRNIANPPPLPSASTGPAFRNDHFHSSPWSDSITSLFRVVASRTTHTICACLRGSNEDPGDSERKLLGLPVPNRTETPCFQVSLCPRGPNRSWGLLHALIASRDGYAALPLPGTRFGGWRSQETTGFTGVLATFHFSGSGVVFRWRMPKWRDFIPWACPCGEFLSLATRIGRLSKTPLLQGLMPSSPWLSCRQGRWTTKSWNTQKFCRHTLVVDI